MAKALLGWIPGGLALMTVWTCAFFTVFLIVPLFIFLAGVIALIVTERKAKSH